MILPRGRIRFSARAMAATIIIAGASARAQDDAAIEGAGPIAPKKEVKSDDPLPRPERLAMYKWVLQKNITDFDRAGGGIDVHLERRLTAELEDLDRTCHLTAAQRKKLQLAGQAEIKRWIDRLDSISREFVDARTIDTATLMDQITDLFQHEDELFREGSFLSKAIVATLSPEQLLARNIRRYELAVSKTVRKLARSAHLSDAQCDKLKILLLTETAPPRRFGQSDDTLVLFQASRLPEAKLKGIITDIQWKVFKRRLITGAEVEAFLKQEGYEFGDGQSPAAPAADLEKSRQSSPAMGRD